MLTDRWLRVLWLAAIHDAGGGDCGSYNRHANAHRQPGRRVACIWIVYTQQGSVTVLQVTGSLLLLILLCYLIVCLFVLEGKQVYCENRSLDRCAGWCLISE